MMSDATALKRKRARLACEPCRERKRKCNGESPCSTCTSWGYECHYQAPRRVRSKPADRGTNIRDQNEPILESSPRQVGRFTETLEVNSGAAFVRKIGLKVDPANAPKLNLFGWNVGRRKSPAGLAPVAAFPIVEILSLMQMRTLANVYFAKVDPCYGFIDASDFFRRMDNRWQPNAVESTYDGVLAGVAALGCLFSGTNINITESHLVELARSISETHVGSVRPSLHLVTVWTLRVIYLRMTAPPYPAWVASSTLMHLIEASRLNQLTADDDRDLDTRRRLIGVAQHLNLWISYDLGLSRVPLGSDALGLPLSRPGDFTTELLGLLPVTASLGPETQRPDQEIEELLHQTLNRTHTKPPSLLCQCNLVLCLLRRLRLTNLTASPTTMTKVLDLLKRSLCAAREMVADCSPWHHVPNVPFQMISIILEMDTSPALELLPEAMQTLRVVASTYDTETMREAYNTACLLILLYERRRRADTRLLSTVLQEYQQSPATESSLQQMATSDEVSWLEGLVADVPTLQGLDFSQFLQPDMLRMSPDASAWGNKSG